MGQESKNLNHPLSDTYWDDFNRAIGEDDHLDIRIQIVDPKTKKYVDTKNTIRMGSLKDWLTDYTNAVHLVFRDNTQEIGIAIRGGKISAIKFLLGICFSYTNISVFPMCLKEVKDNIESRCSSKECNLIVRGKDAFEFILKESYAHNVRIYRVPITNVSLGDKVSLSQSDPTVIIPVITSTSFIEKG